MSPDQMRRLYGKAPGEEVTLEDIQEGMKKPWMSNKTCIRSLLFQPKPPKKKRETFSTERHQARSVPNLHRNKGNAHGYTGNHTGILRNTRRMANKIIDKELKGVHKRLILNDRISAE